MTLGPEKWGIIMTLKGTKLGNYNGPAFQKMGNYGGPVLGNYDDPEGLNMGNYRGPRHDDNHRSINCPKG